MGGTDGARFIVELDSIYAGRIGHLRDKDLITRAEADAAFELRRLWQAGALVRERSQSSLASFETAGVQACRSWEPEPERLDVNVALQKMLRRLGRFAGLTLDIVIWDRPVANPARLEGLREGLKRLP